MRREKLAEVARALVAEPGQQYAMMKKPNPIEGRPRGESGGGSYTPKERSIEDAFEQIRRENAGLTREQRRTQMRRQGQEEFNRVQNMSDAEWEAELGTIRGILKR